MKNADQVIPFDPDYAADFQRLNLEWIRKHFKVEKKDEEQTSNPKAIVDAGGEVLFILRDGKAVATCALIPLENKPGVFELAKMAVDTSLRGQGLGDAIMRAAIDWCRRRGARKLMLLSNTVLTPAIALYKKHGFETVHLGCHPDYQRCNIEMELPLNKEPVKQA